MKSAITWFEIPTVDLAKSQAFYEAVLACASEGQTSSERIRMAVQGDGMRLTWLNRNNAVISLVRCPAPALPSINTGR